MCAPADTHIHPPRCRFYLLVIMYLPLYGAPRCLPSACKPADRTHPPPVNRPGCPGSAASLLPPPRVDRPVQTDTFDFIAAAAAHRVTHVPRLRLTVSSPQPAEPHPGIRVVTLILNGIYILCMESLHFNYWLH